MKIKFLLLLSFCLLLMGCSGGASIALLVEEETFNTSIVDLNSTHTQITKKQENGSITDVICISEIGSQTEIILEVC